MPTKNPQSVDVQEAELSGALAELQSWLATEQFDDGLPLGPSAVYTASLTIWLMILQRMGKGSSLASVVKDLVKDLPPFVPECKRVRERALSCNTSAYSKARKRLPLELVRGTYQRMAKSFVEDSLAGPTRDQVLILDGTTITLPPTDSLREEYPPARNQTGETVWPVMMLLVAHEMETGCALCPTVGPMYGSKATSELKLSLEMLDELPQRTTLLADSGFGIFTFVYSAFKAGHPVVCRLNKQRFESLTAKAEYQGKTTSTETWRLRWQPTAKDRRTTDLPENAEVDVFIHATELPNGEPLYLVTTRRDSPQEVCDLYGRRYGVEHDIRSIKVHMDTENLRSQSPEMVLKELYTSLMTYNLIVQFRYQASQIAKRPPRRLSFTGVWDTMRIFLVRGLTDLDAHTCLEQFERALYIASREVLSERPGRSYPRKAHPRRPKTTKWQKQQRKKPKLEPIPTQ